MPSVRKIAKQAGVSIATVSRALNNDPAVSPKTRELVLSVASRTGYQVSGPRRVTTNVGFVCTGEQSLAHPFEAAVLEGVNRGLHDYAFNVLILDLKRDKRREESFTQYFLRNGVRGVTLRVISENRQICQAIADEGFPHVVISERFDAENIHCIDGDSRADSVRAVEYLIGLGHRRIALAAHSVPDRDHHDRFEGYCEALAKHRIPLDGRLIFRQPASLGGGATVFKMAMSLPERPTAIYFADLMLAVGGVKAAHQMGVRVPDDVSVIGFDDAEQRHTVYPTLTAVCQDAVQLGMEAASHLARVILGEEHGVLQRTIPTFFEINESTGPAPRAPTAVPNA